MADSKIFKNIKIGQDTFEIISAWAELGITKEYVLTLLNRDEYTPIVDSKPTETTTIYVDPASGNQAGFHTGQCVAYPDNDIEDGRGLSIAKYVETNSQGIPTKVYWLHLTDLVKRIAKIESSIGYWNNGV